MAGELAISVYLTAGISGVLVVGLAFPPLTTSNGALSLPPQHLEDISQEFEYCRSSLSGVDCNCFAGISGHVLANQRPEIPTASKTGKYVLARQQALQSCT